jgi:hypothetical protein
MPFSELFWKMYFYEYYTIQFALFFSASMCLCFRASSAALRPAGLRWFEGDKDSVTAVGSSAYGQAGKVVGSAVEFARF